MLDRAVIGPLSILGEKTTRDLAGPEMVLDAFAAPTLPRTGLVSARTLSLIGLNVAFHEVLSISKIDTPSRTD
jgi:hypothetical protein